jgi:hypothetical protein
MARHGVSRRALLGSLASLGVVAGPAKVFARQHTKTPIFQDFSNSYLELIRLLREAAEIEHDLMLQYLYGAFSLKPAYQELVGAPTPNTNTFFGVIVQEMQHLGGVNRLLVDLNAAPVLTRQDFPYESDIYPFAFELVPLSQNSLAKFTYCEAAADALKEPAPGAKPGSPRLMDQLKGTLGSIAPNHVGHLYDAVIETLREVKNKNLAKIEFDAWFESLDHIKEEGEVGHFQFFTSLYGAEHPLLKQTPGVWNLPTSDARYPAYQVPKNPTAYQGHPGSIQDENLRAARQWLPQEVADRAGAVAGRDDGPDLVAGPLPADQGQRHPVRPAEHGLRAGPEPRGRPPVHPHADRGDPGLRPLHRQPAAGRLQRQDLRPAAGGGVSHLGRRGAKVPRRPSAVCSGPWPGKTLALKQPQSLVSRWAHSRRRPSHCPLPRTRCSTSA